VIATDASVPLGATFGPGGAARFLVWAPAAERVQLVLPGSVDDRVRMESLEDGYWGVERNGLRPGVRYGFRVDRGPVHPDPASRSQPDGVHGLSELVAPERFRWSDGRWPGTDPSERVVYELHVGVFGTTPTFDGVAARLRYLQSLGVTAVELMPVAQFPGDRNWGYDGVFPFAVQHSYGGIGGLQRLSDACHARGLSLLVDVVYNHVGPEGNVLPAFGPYFTDRYRTPWGSAVNFDGGGSDEVRRFFRESATWLVATAHLDGLRVDAVHAIVDPTAMPFLAELTEAVHAVGRRPGRRPWVVAESSLNDPRVVQPVADGGLGFDAMWNDDFHHALHVALTGERQGYFVDFDGAGDLRRVLVDGFALAGRRSAYRGRRHGRPAHGVPGDRFVVGTQNHDQVGNRPFGERLSRLVPWEARKLAAGLALLAPFVPLLFMGEEYGEAAPFLYFTSHGDPRLARAVREGRRAEFAAETGGREPPDPQSPATFARSRVDPGRRNRRGHRPLFDLYRELLRLRRAYIVPRRLTDRQVGADPSDPTVLWVARPGPTPRPSLAIFRCGPRSGTVASPPVRTTLRLRVASADRRWRGPGTSLPPRLTPGRGTALDLAPWSFAFYAAGAGG
jgi:maltooligosyltrehalose trehalohydrolase